MSKNLIGIDAENYALEYLIKNKGYIFLNKNFRTRFGEIDLICKSKDGKLVFIEVKSRKGKFKELYPWESINLKKLKHLIKAIKFFLSKYNLHQANFQIDVVSIIFNQDRIIKLQHFENITMDLPYEIDW